MERAVHLSPRDPQIGNWDRRIRLVYLVQSRIDDAIFWLEKARVAAPELYWVHLRLASAYGLKGETNRAAVEIASPTDEPSWRRLEHRPSEGGRNFPDENQCPVRNHLFRGPTQSGDAGAMNVSCLTGAVSAYLSRRCRWLGRRGRGRRCRAYPRRQHLSGGSEHRPRTRLAIMLLLFLALSPRPLAATEGIGIELNRLEEQGSNCRAYLVITNPGELAFSGFKLDLVIFDRSGTIARRLAVDLAPLRPAKTTVKVFDLVDTACPAIGSILVNDVLDCRDASGMVADCVQRLSPSSKLSVPLSK